MADAVYLFGWEFKVVQENAAAQGAGGSPAACCFDR
jgi:hypothetical protein